jgi:hypothetical protein
MSRQWLQEVEALEAEPVDRSSAVARTTTATSGSGSIAA